MYPECRLPQLVFKLIQSPLVMNVLINAWYESSKIAIVESFAVKNFSIESTSDNDVTTSLSNGSNDGESNDDGDEDSISYYEFTQSDESKLKKCFSK